jgi:cell division protein ZapA (FtsZ GTPase activity inhibitor)
MTTPISGAPVTQTARAEPSWYDVTIGGKRFNIASRHGEAHIREVERLLEETYEEVRARAQGQTALNVALLTALNLADQLLSLKVALRAESGGWTDRVESLLQRLDTILGPEEAPDQTR